MNVLDGWEFDLLSKRVDDVMAQAESHLNGFLALEPNDPERETQVNHWTEELRRARALRSKLQNYK